MGGGQKVLLLKEELEKHKDDKDKIIVFTDAYDVLFNGDAEQILARFREFDARVLFSAEGFCWPDSSLSTQYDYCFMLTFDNWQ